MEVSARRSAPTNHDKMAGVEKENAPPRRRQPEGSDVEVVVSIGVGSSIFGFLGNTASEGSGVWIETCFRFISGRGVVGCGGRVVGDTAPGVVSQNTNYEGPHVQI